MIPPPPMLSEDEFRERYRPGMTLFELDPELGAWHRAVRRERRITAIVVGVCVVVVAVVWIVAYAVVKASET